MNKRILFVAGAARSGTTAMVNALNIHPQILMLPERYARLVVRAKALSASDFEEERLFTFREGDSFYNAVAPGTPGAALRDKYAKAVYVGDKIPRLFERYELISKRFEQASIIFMSRNIFDVASSYNRRARNKEDNWPATRDSSAAVEDWNLSHRATLNAAHAFPNLHIMGVDYEEFYFDISSYRMLLQKLGLPQLETDAADQLKRFYARARSLESQRANELTSSEKRYLCMNSDLDAYRSVRGAIGWVASAAAAA